MADLPDYELKRRRAKFHRDTLAEAVNGFIESERHTVRGEPDMDSGKYVFRVPLRPVDPEWSLILGDWIYNTRSSLDHLITALSNDPNNETCQFPIYGNRKDWQSIEKWWDDDPKDRIKRDLHGTPPGTKAVLKPLQPFYGVPRTDPNRHPLFQLQAMSNRDKHRRLNLLARDAKLTFTYGSGKPVFHGPPVDTRITKSHKTDAYTVDLETSELDVDMYLFATHDVALNEPPDLFGELIETLSTIDEFIDSRVFPALRPLLP